MDLEHSIRFLREAPVRVAIFGEFSAGKTTFINALIGEDILSVAVEPTTAVPTRVRYGREFNVHVDRIGGGASHSSRGLPPFGPDSSVEAAFSTRYVKNRSPSAPSSRSGQRRGSERARSSVS